MNPRPANAPEPVLLIIADISGYTRYMTANAKTLAHSQTIITELIHTIVQHIQLPLEVAKLEGDAVFLYCRKQDATHSWAEARTIIGARLFAFFREFSQKLGELSRSTTCDCNACTHIEKLRLKVVAHGGEALFHRVLNFVELAGVDVIIVHRLLKNSVNAEQYLLLTETARRDLELPGDAQLVESAETYDDIGRINTLVYLPEGETLPPPEEVSAGKQFSLSWSLFCKFWFSPFKSKPQFRNVESAVTGSGKAGFAILAAVLTPLFLPVGAVFALVHAIKSTRKTGHMHDCDKHRADGTCCHPRQN